jgi:hypothetical protein
MSKSIQDHISGILSGQKTRWTPERMGMAKDQLFESTVGQTRAQLKQMDASLARRGLMRSGVAARAEKDLRTEGMKAYSKGVRELIMKKMDDEFNDKMKAMDTAVNWLNSERNYSLGKERNQIAREQIAATMAAARLSAQVQREGIKAANGRAAAQLGFARESRAGDDAWRAISMSRQGVAGPGGGFVFQP